MGTPLPDAPSGAALLDVARRSLLDEVVPGLSGRPRYVALMVANAVGIALREIEQADAAAQAWERVPAPDGTGVATPTTRVAAIRDGRHDGDPALHAALLATTEVAAEIWKPAPIRDSRKDA